MSSNSQHQIIILPQYYIILNNFITIYIMITTPIIKGQAIYFKDLPKYLITDWV